MTWSVHSNGKENLMPVISLHRFDCCLLFSVSASGLKNFFSMSWWRDCGSRVWATTMLSGNLCYSLKTCRLQRGREIWVEITLWDFWHSGLSVKRSEVSSQELWSDESCNRLSVSSTLVDWVVKSNPHDCKHRSSWLWSYESWFKKEARHPASLQECICAGAQIAAVH